MSEPIITVPLDSWNKALDLIDALRQRNEKLERVAEAARRRNRWAPTNEFEARDFEDLDTALSDLDKGG